MPNTINQDVNSDEIDDTQFCRDFIRSQNRGIVKSYDDLTTFKEAEHAAEIRALARGMSIREIMDFYCIEYDNLSDNDKFFFCSMFLKGRVTGTYTATQALFGAMKDPKDGQKAALAYLSLFASQWEGANEKAAASLKTPKAIKLEVIGADC